MTVLHSHESSLAGLSYFFPRGSRGIENSAKEMRRDAGQNKRRQLTAMMACRQQPRCDLARALTKRILRLNTVPTNQIMVEV